MCVFVVSVTVVVLSGLSLLSCSLEVVGVVSALLIVCLLSVVTVSFLEVVISFVLVSSIAVLVFIVAVTLSYKLGSFLSSFDIATVVVSMLDVLVIALNEEDVGFEEIAFSCFFMVTIVLVGNDILLVVEAAVECKPNSFVVVILKNEITRSEWRFGK